MWRVGRWVDRLGFLWLSGGVLAWGFLQGFVALTLRIEVAFGVVAIALHQATLSSLFFGAFIAVSAILFVGRVHLDQRDTASELTGQTVTAIVPVYGDGESLSRSVRSLLEATYDNLQIVIVTEPDDPASRRRADDLATIDGVRHLVNHTYPGSKAGAINHAAERTESPYLAVFDADEAVHPSFVAEAVAKLDSNDVVQGRTVPQPAGAVEAMAYYESLLLSYAARRLLYLLTGFRMAASRAVVMRRSAFDRVGGYDDRMLTEDFDFAYRCYTAGLSVTEHLASPSRIHAAHTITDWWGQRKRWMTGYAQVLHKRLATLDPTDRRSVLGAAICTATVIGPALLLSMLSKFAVLFVVNTNEAVLLSLISEYSLQYVVSSRQIFLIPIGALITAAACLHLFDWRSGAVPRVNWYWLLVPVLCPLYGLAALKAVVEYLLTWNGEWYGVEKQADGAHS